MVTIAGAIWSWLRIMNTAIAMIRTGATEATSLPVGVSPMVRSPVWPPPGDGAGEDEDDHGGDDVGQVSVDRGHEGCQRRDLQRGDRERDRAEEEKPEGDEPISLDGLAPGESSSTY